MLKNQLTTILLAITVAGCDLFGSKNKETKKKDPISSNNYGTYKKKNTNWRKSAVINPKQVELNNLLSKASTDKNNENIEKFYLEILKATLDNSVSFEVIKNLMTESEKYNFTFNFEKIFLSSDLPNEYLTKCFKSYNYNKFIEKIKSFLTNPNDSGFMNLIYKNKTSKEILQKIFNVQNTTDAEALLMSENCKGNANLLFEYLASRKIKLNLKWLFLAVLNGQEESSDFSTFITDIESKYGNTIFEIPQSDGEIDATYEKLFLDTKNLQKNAFNESTCEQVASYLQKLDVRPMNIEELLKLLESFNDICRDNISSYTLRIKFLFEIQKDFSGKILCDFLKRCFTTSHNGMLNYSHIQETLMTTLLTIKSVKENYLANLFLKLYNNDYTIYNDRSDIYFNSSSLLLDSIEETNDSDRYLFFNTDFVNKVLKEINEKNIKLVYIIGSFFKLIKRYSIQVDTQILENTLRKALAEIGDTTFGIVSEFISLQNKQISDYEIPFDILEKILELYRDKKSNSGRDNNRFIFNLIELLPRISMNKENLTKAIEYTSKIDCEKADRILCKLLKIRKQKGITLDKSPVDIVLERLEFYISNDFGNLDKDYDNENTILNFLEEDTNTSTSQKIYNFLEKIKNFNLDNRKDYTFTEFFKYIKKIKIPGIFHYMIDLCDINMYTMKNKILEYCIDHYKDDITEAEYNILLEKIIDTNYVETFKYTLEKKINYKITNAYEFLKKVIDKKKDSNGYYILHIESNLYLDYIFSLRNNTAKDLIPEGSLTQDQLNDLFEKIKDKLNPLGGLAFESFFIFLVENGYEITPENLKFVLENNEVLLEKLLKSDKAKNLKMPFLTETIKKVILNSTNHGHDKISNLYSQILQFATDPERENFEFTAEVLDTLIDSIMKETILDVAQKNALIMNFLKNVTNPDLKDAINIEPIVKHINTLIEYKINHLVIISMASELIKFKNFKYIIEINAKKLIELYSNNTIDYNVNDFITILTYVTYHFNSFSNDIEAILVAIGKAISNNPNYPRKPNSIINAINSFISDLQDLELQNNDRIKSLIASIYMTIDEYRGSNLTLQNNTTYRSTMHSASNVNSDNCNDIEYASLIISALFHKKKDALLSLKNYLGGSKPLYYPQDTPVERKNKQETRKQIDLFYKKIVEEAKLVKFLNNNNNNPSNDPLYLFVKETLIYISPNKDETALVKILLEYSKTCFEKDLHRRVMSYASYIYNIEGQTEEIKKKIAYIIRLYLVENISANALNNSYDTKILSNKEKYESAVIEFLSSIDGDYVKELNPFAGNFSCKPGTENRCYIMLLQLLNINEYENITVEPVFDTFIFGIFSGIILTNFDVKGFVDKDPSIKTIEDFKKKFLEFRKNITKKNSKITSFNEVVTPEAIYSNFEHYDYDTSTSTRGEEGLKQYLSSKTT